MNLARFHAITSRYPGLRIAVVGDFCLDRYLEIDPARQEVSLETGLPVHNVVRVRAQPGGAGTILNNLSALGIGTIYPVGFAGLDGEGFELRRALEACAGVRMQHFQQSVERHTFTYCKPLLMAAGKPPVELNRLDLKNWTTTPAELQQQLMAGLEAVAASSDAIVILDQVDIPETGVVTEAVLTALKAVSETHPDLLILADSRRSLRGFPTAVFKMNAAELGALTGAGGDLSLDQTKSAAASLAIRNRHNVFITLAERGMVGATSDGQVAHLPALPVRGEIDVVGAGDAVSANLAAALAAGASALEALELANAAASVVLHKLGTTGTAGVREIAERLGEPPR